MNEGLLVCGALVLALLSLLAIERWAFRRARRRVPLRVHVNGIRGKSSVTRLIAAGLRAGGIKTWAKVTGTLPRLIDEHGGDVPITRSGAASIGEQRAVITEAARAGVGALVIECMALKPLNQSVAEDGFVAAHATVITNVREDHVEVYGEGWEGAAAALARTVPRRGILFTTEGPALPYLRRAAARRRSEIRVVGTWVDDAALRRFSYIEHAENVALALAVCTWAGVPHDIALAGITAVRPDAGALRIIDWEERGTRIRVVNALAANDSESTLALYRMTVPSEGGADRLVLLNTRRDRPMRTRQLARMLSALPAERYFLTGDDARQAERYALAAGISPLHICTIPGTDAAAVADVILREAAHGAVLFAMGNTAGAGLALIERASSGQGGA